MKKIKLFGCFIVVCTTIVCFVLAVDNNSEIVKNLPISNIEAVMDQEQEQGGERWCDKTNNEECFIRIGDAIGISRGILRTITHG